MQVKAVDFAYYVVTDISTSVSFYRDTLGLELERFDEGGYAEFAAPPTTLVLRETDTQVSISPGGGSGGLALAVDDVEDAVDELRDEGTTIMMEPIETPVCDMARVGDPDENHILLHRRHDGTQGRKDPIP